MCTCYSHVYLQIETFKYVTVYVIYESIYSSKHHIDFMPQKSYLQTPKKQYFNLNKLCHSKIRTNEGIEDCYWMEIPIPNKRSVEHIVINLDSSQENLGSSRPTRVVPGEIYTIPIQALQNFENGATKPNKNWQSLLGHMNAYEPNSLLLFASTSPWLYL